jgi:hypothetical protein
MLIIVSLSSIYLNYSHKANGNRMTAKASQIDTLLPLTDTWVSGLVQNGIMRAITGSA